SRGSYTYRAKPPVPREAETKQY
ncbi:MAG: hypothetical protein JWP66_96, partial [Naasia sp.]|nr:hypothetical protein [Naasia sp.]